MNIEVFRLFFTDDLQMFSVSAYPDMYYYTLSDACMPGIIYYIIIINKSITVKEM